MKICLLWAVKAKQEEFAMLLPLNRNVLLNAFVSFIILSEIRKKGHSSNSEISKVKKCFMY